MTPYTQTNSRPGFAGQWTGFINQGGSKARRRLDLLLRLRGQQLSGVGDDDAGMFVLSGEFDEPAQEFRWVQTYLHGPTRYCRGFSDEGRIWGTWRDESNDHGGFQIWPRRAASDTEVEAEPTHQSSRVTD